VAPDAAIGLATASTVVLLIAIIATQWEPRHAHPSPERCPCVECAVYRFRHH